MAVDYRKLNAQTVKDKFPLPRIEDMMDRLAGLKFFCLLDACQGFYQVPLDDESAPKAAFSTPDGHYEPVRLFYRLANGPAVFQRAMTVALGELMWIIVSCFIDDLFFGGRNFRELMEKLEKVLIKLSESRVTLKLSKCEFAVDCVEYLSFSVSADGVRPGSRKLAAITEFPTPKNKHKLKRFLGLTSFFRCFIANFASRAAPLTKLLKQNCQFEWNSTCQQCFENLRSSLMQAPILKLFDPRDVTELHTDACSTGIGGMLLQRKGDQPWQLVYCVSRRTNPQEKYQSSRLELIAAVWSAKRLRSFLLGVDFVLVTDCSAITYLNTQRDLKPQVARWAEQLSEFTYTIRYRPGNRMLHIVAISRAPVEERDKTPPYEYK